MAENGNDMALGYMMARDNNCCGYGYGYGGYGMGGFGGFGYGGDWFAILIILALLGGNNGWGFGGNGGGNGFINYELGKAATQADVANGFTTSEIMSDLNDILMGQTQGFASVQQTLCQGFSGINQTVMNGFHGVDNAVCNLGYRMQSEANNLSRQIGDCCCTTQRGIDGINYNIEKQTCGLQNAIYNATRDIIDNQRCSAERIENRLIQQEMDRLRAENQDLKFERSQVNQNAFIAANQEAQTATLIRRLGIDCPQPTFLVNPPTPVNFPVNSCGQVQFNNGHTCCGCYNG